MLWTFQGTGVWILLYNNWKKWSAHQISKHYEAVGDENCGKASLFSFRHSLKDLPWEVKKFFIFSSQASCIVRSQWKKPTALSTARKKPKKQSLPNDLRCFLYMTKQNESVSSFICSLSIMSEILTVCHSIKGLHRVFWSQLLVKFISQLSIKISAHFLAISEFSRSWPVSTIRYKKLHNSADSPLNLLIWYFLCVTFSIQDIGKKSFEERKVIAGDRGFMILSRTFYT